MKFQNIYHPDSLFKALFFFLILFWLPHNVSSQKLDTRGYLKELGNFSFSNDLGTIHYDNILHHRHESRLSFSKGLELRLDLRSRFLNGYTVQNSPGYAGFLDEDPGYFDGSFILLDSENTILQSHIDRFQLSYFYDDWEFHLGRQRINWGKSQVWNPNDLFNAYAYLDFDYEERPGTDAAYMRYSWSYASSMEMGYRFGKSWNESVLAAMLRTNIGEYDVQVIAGNYFDELVLGWGWSGYMGEAGFNGEVSYFRSRADFKHDRGTLSSSLGLNYMLSSGVFVSSEFLYNGGFDQTTDPIARLSQPPAANDLFIAETGYFLNASYPVSPLTSLNMGFMGSFDERFVILIPQLTYSLSENIDFLLLAQLLKGDLFSQLTETTNLLFFRFKWSY